MDSDDLIFHGTYVPKNTEFPKKDSNMSIPDAN